MAKSLCSPCSACFYCVKAEDPQGPSLSTALRLAAGPDASGSGASDASPAPGTSSPQTDYIKWVDFTVPYEALNKAFRYDVDTCQAPVHLNWVNLLAYLGALYGGDFSKYSPKDLDAAAARLTSGEITMEELTKDMKYYPYYREAYGAVLDGMVGQFQAEIPKSEAPGAYLPSGVDGGAPGDPETIWVTKYGLKAFFSPGQGISLHGLRRLRRFPQLRLQAPPPGARHDGPGGNPHHRS